MDFRTLLLLLYNLLFWSLYRKKCTTSCFHIIIDRTIYIKNSWALIWHFTKRMDFCLLTFDFWCYVMLMTGKPIKLEKILSKILKSLIFKLKSISIWNYLILDETFDLNTGLPKKNIKESSTRFITTLLKLFTSFRILPTKICWKIHQIN